MKAGTLSGAAAVLLSLLAGSAIAGEPKLSGTWIIGDGQGVLTIRGSKWMHPKHGAATIKVGTGASDIEVFYNEHQGVRCAYRTMSVGEGQILFLETADKTQNLDFCPAGKLSRAD